MPSLRIDQSDLKCKNGCDYFGNPQWQGYCSKCHREQLQRQRRAEKASSATLPKPEQKKPERGLKLATHSSFSKFEEKRLRQSETLKKANLLKFSVFKKSSTVDEHDTPERKPPEFKIPSTVNEGMKRDFRARFPSLPPGAGREARAFVHLFIMDVIKCSNVMSVDELSERVQRHYQHFMKNMDASPHLANVEPETKELLIDFVEKHAMTYLHELPGVVFSPHGSDDERLDRAMSERVQQLSWLRETHLDCALRASPAAARLLYRAIGELLGMDGAASPGGKLARVRRACRHVLALCAGPRAPASADDLLPALIFTVLKANPPRLVSNINFVTRFCNAQRLMTGEGGYYFTNLCCAVSFIENLNAESLNMDKKEFDCYMAMPASIGGSTWAAALSLCGAVREAEEQNEQIEKLMEEVKTLRSESELLATNAETFEKEIAKKVQDVLAKTPLEIKPRREPPRLANLRNSATLIDLSTPEVQQSEEISKNQTPQMLEISQMSDISQIPELSQMPEIPQISELSQMPEIPELSQMPEIPQISELSQMPEISELSQMPEISELSQMPEIPGLSQMPEIPELSQMPEIPQISELSQMPEISELTQSSEISQTSQTTEKPQISQMPGINSEPIEPILIFEDKLSPPKSPQNQWALKQTGSFELLTPSPLGYTPFDSRSIDELMTPDEFGSDHLAPGLSNINYDIDLSDFSGDNSLAEDAKEQKDPFSPDGLKKFDPFQPHTSQEYKVLEKFDEFSLIDPKTNEASESFEVVHRSEEASRDPFSPVQKEASILDETGSPSAECFLPSPMLPQTSKPM